MTSPEQPSSASPPTVHDTQVISSNVIFQPGHILAGRFSILSLKAQGRFGAVYQATDLQLNIKVAIKVLDTTLSSDPQKIKSFKNELILVRQLSHPNIIRVHEYYHQNDVHFITMDWIEGTTLEQYVGDNTLTDDTKVKLLNQLLDGLSFAQKTGVTHKDIKPENILIDNDQKLYIADFGLSVFNDNPEASQRAATPYYSTPEYLQQGTINLTTDLYAVGVIAFQLFCDDVPFKGNNLKEIISNKLIGEPKFKGKGQFTQNLKPWVLSALAAHPEARQPDIAQAQADFVRSTHQDSKPSLFPRLIAAVLCFSILGIYFVFQSFNKNTEGLNAGDDELFSIAILPTLDDDPVFTSKFDDFLNQRLTENALIRTVPQYRVDEIFQRLGLKTPLTEKQKKVVFELLNADILISIEKQPLSQTKSQLTYRLNNLNGNLISNVAITEIDYDAQDWAKSTQPFISDLESKLALETNQSITLTRDDNESFPQFLQFIEAEDLFFQGNDFDSEKAFEKVLTMLGEQAPKSFIGVFTQARLNELTGDMDKAESQYKKLLSAFPYDPELKIAVADFYQKVEQPRKSIPLLKEAVNLDPNHPIAWFMLGKAAYTVGDFDVAVDEYFVKALIIAKKLKNEQLQAKYLNAFGVIYEQLGENELALDYYQQALKQRKAINDLPGVAKTLTNLSDVYIATGQLDLAESQLIQSKEIYEQLNDQEGLANNYNALGLLAEEQSKYKQALTFFRDSLNIRMEANNVKSQAEGMNNIGFSYFMLLDPEHALVYWRQAEQLYQKVRFPIGIVRVRQNLGQMELVKGNWRNAYHIFNNTLEDAKQLNSMEESIVAQSYLAKLAFLQGNFNNSTDELENNYQKLQKLNDTRGIAEFGLWLADWSLQLGDQSRANQILEDLSPVITNFSSREFKSRLSYYKLKSEIDKRLNAKDVSSSKYTNLQVEIEQLIGELHVQQATDRMHKLIYIQLLMNKINLKLAASPNSSLSNSEQSEVSAIFDQLNNIDFSLYQYEYIDYLHLLASFQFKQKSWLALKDTLRKAEINLRKTGDYWRSIQFDALRIEFAEIQNRPSDSYRKNLTTKLNKLAANLPEDSIQKFLTHVGLAKFGHEIKAEQHD